MNMKQHNPDVLIYIDKLKRFITSNDETRDFFLKDIDEDMFFEKVTEFSASNLEEKGEPDLTREQLEQIRIESKMVAKDAISSQTDKIFFNNFSLN